MMEKICCEPIEHESLTGTSDGSSGENNRNNDDGGEPNQKVLERDYSTECPRLYKLLEAKDWE